jgi:hypothetical protein
MELRNSVVETTLAALPECCNGGKQKKSDGKKQHVPIVTMV